MELSSQHISILITAILSSCGSYLYFRLTQKKPKLIYYLSSLSDFDVRTQTNTVQIYTHSITIINNGNATAEKIEISHKFLPKDYKISPTMPHVIKGNIIEIERLNAEQNVQISYLYFTPYTIDQIHDFVRSKECLAKIIPVTPAKIYPKWLRIILGTLIVIGAITILYLVITIILYAVSQAYSSQ